MEEAIAGVDFFIIDCKDLNSAIYESYTTKSAKLMLENLEYICQKVGPERMMVRVPHIPDFNTEEDRNQTIEQLKKMGITNIDVFDYIVDFDRSKYKA